MKPLSGRAHSTRLSKKPAHAPLQLKVFIGYGDVPAVRRATSTVADAVLHSGHAVEVHPMLWRFDQLGSSHWRDRAIGAAKEADIVVLACSGSASFSPAVEEWVNAFLAANRGRRATIVAILGRSDAWTISIEHPPVSANAGSGAPELAA